MDQAKDVGKNSASSRGQGRSNLKTTAAGMLKPAAPFSSG